MNNDVLREFDDMPLVPPPAPPLRVIGRALRGRCPVCGQGRLFRRLDTLPSCTVCHFHYEREAGYFTNTIALNYTIVGTLLTLIVAPIAYFSPFPVWQMLTGALALAVVLPLLFLLPVRALWLAVDVIVRPPQPVEFTEAAAPEPRTKDHPADP